MLYLINQATIYDSARKDTSEADRMSDANFNKVKMEI
uniref:Type II toxin-antitoxin system antitoxin, RelB/DinJ family n=1 Tax=Heterorhabditis bacteriophora TaxID=37862 RepID=A0A1I7X3K6_HETBA